MYMHVSQVSVYRTIGPLVLYNGIFIFETRCLQVKVTLILDQRSDT